MRAEAHKEGVVAPSEQIDRGAVDLRRVLVRGVVQHVVLAERLGFVALLFEDQRAPILAVILVVVVDGRADTGRAAAVRLSVPVLKNENKYKTINRV